MYESAFMLEKIAKALRSYKGKRLAVISHIRPDADCIGAQVALCLWLKKHNVTALAFNDNEVPPNLQWLTAYYPVKATQLTQLASCDAIVFVDGNHPSRFGLAGEFAEKCNKPLYMIDHHPDPAPIFTVGYSDDKASSASEMVYRLYEKDLTLLDLPASEAIYAGLMTDTGSFRFDSVTHETHQAVATMMKLTALQTEPIHRRIFEIPAVNQLWLLAKVLETLRLHNNNRFATFMVTKEMLRETNTSYHDVEGMVNYGLSLKGVRAAVIFSELEDRVKMSFRSNSYVDVNQWARAFGGGGHIKAAGGMHEGPMGRAIQEVITYGSRQLRDEDRRE